MHRHPKYSTRSNANLRFFSTSWNFLTPAMIPATPKKSHSRSINQKPLTGTESTNALSRQSFLQTKPMVSYTSFQRSILESENASEPEAAEENVGKLANTVKAKEYFQLWAENEDKKRRLPKQSAALWDLKNEKPVKIFKHILLKYKAGSAESSATFSGFVRKRSLEPQAQLVQNLLKSPQKAEYPLKITLLAKDSLEASSKASSPCGSEALSPKNMMRHSHFDPGSVAKVKKSPEAAWWVNLDNGARKLLCEYAEKTAKIRAQKYAVQECIAKNAKTNVHVKPINLQKAFALLPKEYKGSAAEKLRAVTREMNKTLIATKKAPDTGIMKDRMVKMLEDGKELAKWCLEMHELRSAAKIKWNRNSTNYIRNLKRSYTLTKKV